MRSLQSHLYTAGRDDIAEFVEELESIMEEYNHNQINEAARDIKGVSSIKTKQIERILRAAAAVSQGKSIDQTLSDVDGGGKESLVKQMIGSIRSRFDQLKNSEPVVEFDEKLSGIIRKWKGTLGPNSPAVQKLRKLGQSALNNPKTTAFVVGIATALTTALRSPAFDEAAATSLDKAQEAVDQQGEAQ